ncbi:DUF1918 domain-containing protein [Nocardia australiensis]|uniref:DUF1918 domain-containing protein n=1 Tax=Nocardia australiensis TaxID=2887191 RepID=UPI001D15BAB9|nr:DUF1918 domain-containing protein [Nocardia australiensis]
MYAEKGNWLLVEGRTIDDTPRRGLIEEVHSPDGSPPYLVHWTDTGHRALTYPGPDAHVLTAEQLRAQEDIAAAHFSSMQHTSGEHP